MAAPGKPRHSSGYSREETREVESTLLTVAVTLGAYFDRLCIVGGLVPSLLLDGELADEDDDRHVGSGDVDVALHIGLLNDGDYAEVSDRLRREGFEADVNEEGNKTLQRWRLGSSRSRRSARSDSRAALAREKSQRGRSRSAGQPPSSSSSHSPFKTAASPRTPMTSSM